MIHVSGRDRKDDFEDDQLAPPKPFMSIIEQIDLLQLKEFREIKAYLPIKTFKLRKLFEQFIFLLDGILALCVFRPLG